MIECDVLVVGSRIAGSVVASCLGDEGLTVILVDKDTFPSPTISTHYFRGTGLIGVIQKLGIYDEVMHLGAPKLNVIYLYPNGNEHPVVQDTTGTQGGAVGHSLSIRREVLDNLLVQRAKRTPSVTVYENTVVTNLTFKEQRVVGASLHTPEETIDVRCKLVIGADGRNSRIAKAVDAQYEELEEGHRAFYYQYFRNFSPPGTAHGMEFSVIGDEGAYVFPSDDGLACIVVTLNRNGIKEFRKHPEASYRRILERHRGLSARLCNAEPHGDLMGMGPIPNYIRVPYGKGWALVGDAGIHQDPWSGFGMDFASVHACILSEYIAKWLRGSMSEEEALAEYHRRRNEHSYSLYQWTVSVSRNLSQVLSQSPT